MPASPSQDLRRRLPSVDQVLQDPRFSGLLDRHGRGVGLRALRELLDTARDRAAAGDGAGLQEALDHLEGDLTARVSRPPRPSLALALHPTRARAPSHPRPPPPPAPP